MSPQRWLVRYLVEIIAALFAVLGLVEIWVAPTSGWKLVTVPTALVATLPLLLRRRFPLAAPVIVFAAVAAIAAASPDDVKHGATPPFFALLLAFWIVGAENERDQAIAGVTAGFAAAAVIAAGEGNLHPQLGDGDIDISGFLVLGGGLALVAFVLKRRARQAVGLEQRAARLEREREERARAAVAEERARIARELHDVIAHSVGVMTVQAGAARLLLDEEPARARAPLLAVEESGRQALGEMRRLLGILRHDGSEPALAPQPGIADLDGLVEQARGAGLPVELTIEGQRERLAPGVELAAYRIVQEALTNARKHAIPGRAQVAVRYARDALELEITNDCRARPSDAGSGHGLVGMRERVALYGGELDVGPQPGGGYAVRARLPLEARP
jgi:signal transduction histidine kinase